MKLEYDASKLPALSEKDLLAVHKELTQVEKDAHKARRLVWEELRRKQSARTSEATREKGRQTRYRSKVRDYEKELAKTKSPGVRRLIEMVLASMQVKESYRLAKRGRTITADRELRRVNEGKKA